MHLASQKTTNNIIITVIYPAPSRWHKFKFTTSNGKVESISHYTISCNVSAMAPSSHTSPVFSFDRHTMCLLFENERCNYKVLLRRRCVCVCVLLRWVCASVCSGVLLPVWTKRCCFVIVLF